jgi:hypothetical protein
LSPPHDTQTCHLKKTGEQTLIICQLCSPISFSFITVSEENIHSRPCNKQCHYHFNWFNTFTQKKTSNLSTHCYRHTILHFHTNSNRSLMTVNILVLCSSCVLYASVSDWAALWCKNIVPLTTKKKLVSIFCQMAQRKMLSQN